MKKCYYSLKQLLQYFVVVLGFFIFLQKPLFLLINWKYVANNCSFLDLWQIYMHGLRLDVATACYITTFPLLLCFVQCVWRIIPLYAVWKCYNILIALLISLIAVADASLYEFWEFKLDTTVFMYLGDPKNAAASVSALYIAVHVVGWFVLSLLCFFCLSQPLRRKEVLESAVPVKWYQPLIYMLYAALLFAGMRGISLWPNNPGVCFYTNKQFCNHAALNPAFNVMYSVTRRQDFGNEFLSMDEDECAAIFNPMFPTSGMPVDTLLLTSRPDIVVILAEGMGAIFVESLTGRKKESVAVCLDSLTREGVSFTHCYCSSFRTDRGIVAAISGYPGQPTTSIMRYTGKVQSLPGLPSVLRKNGYITQALYSSDPTFFNMSNYLICSGHDRIVSQDDFPVNERITKWGVPDHIAFDWLYDDLMEKQAKKQTPSYTTMLTISSHNPFDVPDFTRYKDEHLNAFAYTDSCIGHFVRKLEKTPVWDNLLIIITADHGYNWKPLASPDFAPVPFIMVGGAICGPRTIGTITCQTDLPATLLGQMGIAHSEFKFSRDVTADTYVDPMAINTFNNGFTIFDTTGCTVYDNVAKSAVYGDDSIRIKRGKAFLQVLYNDLDKR